MAKNLTGWNAYLFAVCRIRRLGFKSYPNFESVSTIMLYWIKAVVGKTLHHSVYSIFHWIKKAV